VAMFLRRKDGKQHRYWSSARAIAFQNSAISAAK
jgi:hypothetical protein